MFQLSWIQTKFARFLSDILNFMSEYNNPRSPVGFKFTLDPHLISRDVRIAQRITTMLKDTDGEQYLPKNETKFPITAPTVSFTAFNISCPILSNHLTTGERTKNKNQSRKPKHNLKIKIWARFLFIIHFDDFIISDFKSNLFLSPLNKRFHSSFFLSVPRQIHT